MSDLFIYLLKVSLGLGIILIPYYFLFRGDPNLVIKRFYLLSGLVAAWVFPLITFTRPRMIEKLTPTVFIDPGTSVARDVNVGISGTDPGIAVDWVQVALIAYLAGLSFMLFKSLFILVKWNLTWQKTKDEDGVAFTRNNQVFTIFKRIFVPGSLRDKEDLENILLHEKAHIQQLHFIDLMLMEFTLLLTWFNPFSWLISRMIKENHEHLADRQVLSAGVNSARYRAQLLNHTLGVNVFRLGNQFNHSLTFKRFNMMKKPKKSPLGIIKFALLIPAVLIAMGLTTGMAPSQKPVKGKVILADLGDPAIGASVVIRNGTSGTVVDQEGRFVLQVEGDPELAISFVGYSTRIIKASKIGNKPIYLERSTYTIDLNGVDAGSEASEKGGNEGIAVRSKDGSEKNPVYLVDGKVITDIEDIDPGTIESVTVIKDPDSELVKKYKAKDGLVMITLKEAGEEGTSQVKEVQIDSRETLETKDEIFYIVEDMPMFPGGKAALKNFIDSNLVYPESARRDGIEGEVFVQFQVNVSGKLEDIQVVRSSYNGFDQPAMDVFKDMPDWSPARQRGKPVMVQVVVPVRFHADKE